MSWGEALSVSEHCRKSSIVSKPTADFILLNSQPMSISHNYLMHFITQSKTLKFYCPAQPTNNNFSVIMKCITKAFIPLKSVTFNLCKKINFAVKWSMRVFLAVHLIKENKILALTAFVSKKKKDLLVLHLPQLNLF